LFLFLFLVLFFSGVCVTLRVLNPFAKTGGFRELFLVSRTRFRWPFLIFSLPGDVLSLLQPLWIVFNNTVFEELDIFKLPSDARPFLPRSMPIVIFLFENLFSLPIYSSLFLDHNPGF